MKLTVEQAGGPFYDAGKAPAEEAAESIAPEAVVVNVPATAEPAPAPESPAEEPREVVPDLTIQLDRRFDTVARREEFRLLRRIGYNDDAPGIGLGTIMVPANLETWTTDLTSVPACLTWLVPKTGAHLPAAILHDGLVLDKNEPMSYIAKRVIYRDEADRVFRDAMAKTGTGLIRRWMVWAAVTAATMHHARQVDWGPAQKWHYRLALWGTLAVIVMLGLWSTSDLLDVPGVPGVPWIGEQPVQALVGGVTGAIIIPLLLGATWGKFRIAGWIIGPLVALIVPAVLPIVVIGALYCEVEQLQESRPWLVKLLAIVFIGAVCCLFAASWSLA